MSAEGPGTQPRRLRFSFVLRNRAGEVLEVVGPEHALLWEEGAGRFIPGLEAALAVMLPGQRRTIEVACADAYGPRDESAVQQVPRDAVPVDDLQPGDVFRAGEEPDAPVVTIVSVDAAQVVLDANHPLAGHDLIFDLTVQAATD